MLKNLFNNKLFAFSISYNIDETDKKYNKYIKINTIEFLNQLFFNCILKI